MKVSVQVNLKLLYYELCPTPKCPDGNHQERSQAESNPYPPLEYYALSGILLYK